MTPLILLHGATGAGSQFQPLVHELKDFANFSFDFEAVYRTICSKIFVETQFIVNQFDEVVELKDLFMEQSNFFSKVFNIPFFKNFTMF